MSGEGAAGGAGGSGGRRSSTQGEKRVAARLKGKVVVVGEIAVGKTCVLSRFTTGAFDKASKPSIGVAFSQKAVVVDHHSVRFELWDTAGQERFRSVNTLYYRGAAAGIVIYDITNRRSFETVQAHWLAQLQEHAEAELVIAVVGNKCDLESERVVSEEEGRKFAEERGFLFLETSARTGKHINELFSMLAREAVRQFEAEVAGDVATPTSPGESGRKKRGFQLIGIDREVAVTRQDSDRQGSCCS